MARILSDQLKLIDIKTDASLKPQTNSKLLYPICFVFGRQNGKITFLRFL